MKGQNKGWAQRYLDGSLIAHMLAYGIIVIAGLIFIAAYSIGWRP